MGDNFHFASFLKIPTGGATVSLANLEPVSIKDQQKNQPSVQNTPRDTESLDNSPKIEELSPTYNPDKPVTLDQKDSKTEHLSQTQSKQKVPKIQIEPESASSSQRFPSQRVLHIDPKLASDKLREFSAQGLVSPSHPRTPSPPLGTILQTPRDTTPTQVADTDEKDSKTSKGPAPGIPHQTYPPAITPDQHVRQKEPTRNTYVPPQPNWNEVPQTRQQPHTSAQAINDFIAQLPTMIPPITKEYISTSTSPIRMESEKKSSPEPTIPISDPEEMYKEKIYQAKKRADYRVKFSILREAYPQMEIPEPTEDQSLGEIEAMYQQYVKRIHIDSSVEQNKVYLLILWLLIEVVGGRFLRLPFSGYTLNQFKYMNKYQMLLIELGEKSYETTMGEGWPVEIRIGAMALFNGVIFILVQMLANKVGSNMAEELRELIGNFLTQNRGVDVLKRAAEATADNPPPPQAPQEAQPPLGGLGNIIAQLASAFTGIGGGNAGANNQAQEQPQLRRPTTFASRRRNQPNN